MSTTTVIIPSQLKLGHARLVLKQWQDREDAEHRSRHGRCLEAVRFALSEVGMELPPRQPRPNNVAFWCGHELVRMPDKYGWERIKPPFPVRYTLDMFAACGRLPDGRVAGHVALCDHQTRTLFSSTNYILDAWWMERRYASFVPVA